MPIAVIVGGSGALGGAFISHLNTLNYTTINIDLFPNSESRINCTPDSIETIEREIIALSSDNNKVELIVNAAGGWAGGSASDPEFAEKSKKMWEMNVSSAILAAQLASKFLIKDGLFVLVGAKGVAIHKTPEMLAYAMAKTAVASLAANMSVKSIFSVTILLPEVLDTPANRLAMPKADVSKWTPVARIAEKVAEFVQLPREKINGTGWMITTSAGETDFVESTL